MFADRGPDTWEEFDEAEFGFTPTGLLRIFDQLPVALAVTRGVDHVFVYANGLYRRIHEPLHGPLLGRTVGEVFRGTLDDDYMRIRHRVFAEQVPHKTAAVPIPLADRITYWDITLIPVGPVVGQVSGILSVAVETTESVEAQAAASRYTRELEAAAAEASIERQRLAVAVEATAIGIWEWNLASGAVIWSDRQREIFGLSADAAVTYEVWHDRLHPEDRERVLATINALLEPASDGRLRIEHRILLPNGEVRWIAAHGRMLYAGEGAERRAVRLIGTVLDATARERAEARLREAVAGKDLLLREAHHRVKNSLQLVSAMLSMQERAQMADGASALRDAAARIRTIARLHDQLHRASSTDRIELSAYLAALCQDLSRSSGRPDIGIAFSGTDLWLANERAIPVALILNELVTNALKYAYPRGGGGVQVTLASHGEARAVLMVGDRGVGLTPGAVEKPATSLGLTMVRHLSRSLGGTLEIGDNRPGARFELRFAIG